MFALFIRCPSTQTFVNNDCRDGSDSGIGGFECTRAGLFEDRDCQFYIFCNGNLQSNRIQCPAGTYFSTQSLSCIRGVC